MSNSEHNTVFNNGDSIDNLVSDDAESLRDMAAPLRGGGASIRDLAAQKIKQASGRKIIERREHIPGHKKILTLPHGEFPLTPEQMKHYVGILLNEKHRTIMIICSIEAPMTGKSKVDHIQLTLRDRMLNKGYKNISVAYASASIIEIIYEDAQKSSSEEEEAAVTSELQNDYDDILREAVEERVSDIHIEVRRDQAIVRYRKDGVLGQKYEWPVQYARRLASVIYQVIAEVKDLTFKEGEPQDAVVDRDLGNQRIRVRLATMPAYPDGFDMVMRILPMGASGRRKDTLENLGYTPEQIELMAAAIAKPVGVTIIAGTTGSGKSTSLKCIITGRIEDHHNNIKVITVEDPPEYEIKYATQVPVQRSRTQEGKNPFAAAIRAAMRSDPDILMVGEVRDPDSAALLVSAVQSGHQAFTTVHAASAIGIVARLRSLGILSDVLGSPDFLSGLVYQTLIPTICPSCSIPMSFYMTSTAYNAKAGQILKRIAMVAGDISKHNVRFKNEDGCPECRKGVTGRTVCAEVVVPDHTMVSYFARCEDIKAYYHFKKNGGVSALASGIKKMLAGICDPYDVEHKLGPLTAELEAFSKQPINSPVDE